MKLVPWSNDIDEQLIFGKECLVELPLCSKLVKVFKDIPTYLSLTFSGGYYYFKTIDAGDLCEQVLITDNVDFVKRNILLLAVVEESGND